MIGDKTDTYLKYLLQHLDINASLSIEEKNKHWLDKYNFYKTDIRLNDLEKLPEIITLIYPDFLYNSKGEYIGELLNYSAKKFNTGINESDDCQYYLISTLNDCEFNHYRKIRNKCEADHLWPFSLGGPSIITNRILLCKFHNIAKSNSIIENFWDNYPIWLNDYLSRMRNLKT